MNFNNLKKKIQKITKKVFFFLVTLLKICKVQSNVS